ncbi:MAG TPA: ATP-binding protein, partial [Polyangiales bacterium]
GPPEPLATLLELLMSGIHPLIEHVPMPAYLFRLAGDDFLLEAISAIGRQLNPGIVAFVGRSLTGLYSDQPGNVEAARRCVQEGGAVVREVVMRRYDRTAATLHVRLSFVSVPPEHMAIYMQELRSPEAAEAAFHEAEARYRSLIASLPDGLLVRGGDGRVLACNDAALGIFGAKTQADLVGTMGHLAPGARVETEAHEAVTELPGVRVLRTGKPERAQVYTLVHADEARQFLRIASQPILGPDGAVAGSVTTYTDITEQRKLEEELRRSHRLESIGRLAGGIAHDFNNLLAAMMGSLELLEDVCPAPARADLTTVRHAASRARDLTRQLLAFARKQPVEFKLVELSSLVLTVERMLRRLVGANVQLLIEPLRKANVRADASMLEQVLVNLVVNASEAMPKGGDLHIRIDVVEPTGDAPAMSLLEVSDSGVGMDQETRRQVFDPFFTTKAHGTGLGLASSYGIVKQHGGDIVVESERGRGTRFRVLLPFVASEASPAERASLPLASIASKGWALVIDDEDLVRSMTGRLLESLGYQVLSAGSANEALASSRAHAGPIAVLLCDVTMPGRDGPSIAEELLRERPDLKVLFVSGYAASTQHDLPIGSLYLQKPYRRAELAAKLEELTRNLE